METLRVVTWVPRGCHVRRVRGGLGGRGGFLYMRYRQPRCWTRYLPTYLYTLRGLPFYIRPIGGTR